MFKNLISIILVSILLAGCATAYKPSGFSGGFEDMKLQDDIFKISFSGNAYTGKERAKNFALLRAAELTLENGYQHFIILEGESFTKTSSYTTPVQSNTYGTAYGYGNSASYSGTTYYSGGQTYIYNKPNTVFTIKCLKEKPDDENIFVYDAQQLKSNLRSQYKLDKKKKKINAKKEEPPVEESHMNFSS